MNVYDFDETIYKDDCTRDFVLYCFLRFPKCYLSIFNIVFNFIKYSLNIIDKTTFKEKGFSFLKHLDNIDDVINDFILKNSYKVQKWYLDQSKEDDLIISASPYFLVKPFLENTEVIATNVNKNTGKIIGLNCYGEEKVKRYTEVYKDKKVFEFYSDSLSDTPMAKLAEKAFLVKNGKIFDWKFNEKK